MSRSIENEYAMEYDSSHVSSNEKNEQLGTKTE